jgi:hypothetical protein
MRRRVSVSGEEKGLYMISREENPRMETGLSMFRTGFNMGLLG